MKRYKKYGKVQVCLPCLSCLPIALGPLQNLQPLVPVSGMVLYQGIPWEHREPPLVEHLVWKQSPANSIAAIACAACSGIGLQMYFENISKPTQNQHNLSGDTLIPAGIPGFLHHLNFIYTYIYIYIHIYWFRHLPLSMFWHTSNVVLNVVSDVVNFSFFFSTQILMF